MKPTPFPEQNFIFKLAGDKTGEQDLPVCADRAQGIIVSCWILSDEDIEKLIEHRRVWLHIWGQGMPPVYVGTEYPFAVEANEFPEEISDAEMRDNNDKHDSVQGKT